MLSWVVPATLHQEVTQNSNNSVQGPELPILLLWCQQSSHHINILAILAQIVCDPLVLGVQLENNLTQLVIVKFDVEVYLLVKCIRVIPVVVLFEDLDLLEFDEQSQLHLIDLVLAFDQFFVLQLDQLHLSCQLRVQVPIVLLFQAKVLVKELDFLTVLIHLRGETHVFKRYIGGVPDGLFMAMVDHSAHLE